MPDHRRFIIQVLTPVHIGSGVTLPRSEVIYDEKERRSYILDVDAMLEALGPSAVGSGRIPQLNDLFRLARQRGIRPETMCWQIMNARFPDRTDLRMCVRDGQGRPLIPGSSIKGAFRTALLANLLRDPVRNTLSERGRNVINNALSNLPNNPTFAARNLEKATLRPDLADTRSRDLDPHDDPFRVLGVTDATFPTDKTHVQYAKVSSPAARPDALKPYNIAVEAISPESKAECEIRLDDFLGIKNAKRLGFDQAAPDWSTLTSAARRQAKHLLDIDIVHFGRLGMEGPKKVLENVRSNLAQHADDVMLLRLGWGIGWSGTTGAIIGNDERKKLIEKYRARLSKHGTAPYTNDKPFPKSRKVTGLNNAEGVFGWIALWPARSEERIADPKPVPVHLSQDTSRMSGRTVGAAKGASARPKSPPSPPQTPGDRIITQISVLRVQQIAGAIKGLYDAAIRDCPDPADRRKALAAILETLKKAELHKKWKKKDWVASLLAELDK